MEEIFALLKSPGWWFSTVFAAIAVSFLTKYFESRKFFEHFQSGRDSLRNGGWVRVVQIFYALHILILFYCVFLLARANYYWIWEHLFFVTLSSFIPVLHIFYFKKPFAMAAVLAVFCIAYIINLFRVDDSAIISHYFAVYFVSAMVALPLTFIGRMIFTQELQQNNKDGK